MEDQWHANVGLISIRGAQKLANVLHVLLDFLCSMTSDEMVQNRFLVIAPEIDVKTKCRQLFNDVLVIFSRLCKRSGNFDQKVWPSTLCFKQMATQT